MSVLFFWKWDNYSIDISESKAFNLNQDNELMLKLKSGEHIWAFTRRPDKTYVLAADLIVIQTQHNPPGHKYGRYRASADPQSSRYFDIHVGPDAEVKIKSLSFYGEKKRKVKALGQMFQGRNGVRLLTTGDERELIAFSSGLPTLP